MGGVSMPEFKNKETFKIKEQEALLVERAHYINQSYEGFISILVREFSNHPTDKLEEMIEHYRVLYQNSYVELRTAQDTILSARIGYLPEKVKFSFDFDYLEVIAEW